MTVTPKPTALTDKKAYSTTHTQQADFDSASPMIQQFLKVKQQYATALLFYRMGDFYETFFEDALTASQALEITLTGRDAGGLGRIPMAGVPIKAADGYIQRLLAMQFKVAICEQTEDPAQAKGLVERRVVRVLSSGTLTESAQLKSDQANYLVACWVGSLNPAKADKETCALAYVDVSTGAFRAASLTYAQLLAELARLNPAELLVKGKREKGLGGFGVMELAPQVPPAITERFSTTPLDEPAFQVDKGSQALLEQAKVTTLESLAVHSQEDSAMIRACGALLSYLEQTFLDEQPQLEPLKRYRLSDQLFLPANTRDSLELFETQRSSRKDGSLFAILNKTVTAMGARCLREWVGAPLTNLERLSVRHDTVEALVNATACREQIREALPGVYDMERLATRLANGTATPRDCVALKQSLFRLPALREALLEQTAEPLTVIVRQTEPFDSLALELDQWLMESPPLTLKEGQVIQDGAHPEVDRLRALMTNQREWLQQFEQVERERTGARSLKVVSSSAFGTLIEISRAQAKEASDKGLLETYRRKQTLTNSERFISPELQAHEQEVLQATQQLVHLESELFLQLRQRLQTHSEVLKTLAKQLAELDCYQSLATVAVERHYTRPQLDSSLSLELKDSRHPVLEALLPVGQFVANHCQLAGRGDVGESLVLAGELPAQVQIITGPNMAGKSTYMRQVALIILMAQMGSFVPATAARIGLVDALYTRIGAVDDLSSGQSTFMVEMTETAQILNGASGRSLVILDEVGRGTSTYDGVAIAWSVVDYLAKSVRCRTLFATHYHELNVLEGLHDGRVQNVRVCVSEQDGELAFLHRVQPGAAQKSYGLQVARMAGLPLEVLSQADRQLSQLQKQSEAHLKTRRAQLSGLNDDQLQLFSS